MNNVANDRTVIEAVFGKADFTDIELIEKNLHLSFDVEVGDDAVMNELLDMLDACEVDYVVEPIANRG